MTQALSERAGEKQAPKTHASNSRNGCSIDSLRPPSPALKASKKKALFVLGTKYLDFIYPPAIRRDLESLVDFVGPPQTAESIFQNPELLGGVEVLFTGWETVRFDEEILVHASDLEAVFHGAGSIRPFVTDAFWTRNIVITSALLSNAIPVAEYTLGVILLSMKQFWRQAAFARNGLGWGPPTRDIPGCYHSKVGLVSFGSTARKVLDLLRNFEMDVVVYCPLLTAEEADQLGVTLATLEQVFHTCEVVSLHTPVLPETIGLISGKLISSMKEGATLINTARGVIINEREMIEVLRRRNDLTVVTDVTDPHEPPEQGSPILTLPNIVVTPHIAGSQGRECSRMGAYMLEEVQRYLEGQPLRWALNKEAVQHMA